jgi:hypothetical protein
VAYGTQTTVGGLFLLDISYRTARYNTIGPVPCFRLARATCKARALLAPAMNLLIVGTTDKKETIFQHLPESFLLIDDGSIIDALRLPPRRKVTTFDFTKHSFNPLKDIDYRRAREFISVLDAVFPEGENTLTKKTSNFILLNALLSKPKSLDKLIRPGRDSAQTDAYQKIQTLLLSPVLKSVLCRPTNFSFDGIILARLNRAELGDFDCFVLANLLIANYKGQIVIPDFGFYACPHHTSLIRQNRLIAGVNFFDEVPKLRNHLLLIDNKIGHHCTAEDAECLAGYAGLTPNTVAHTEFVQRSIE